MAPILNHSPVFGDSGGLYSKVLYLTGYLQSRATKSAYSPERRHALTAQLKVHKVGPGNTNMYKNSRRACNLLVGENGTGTRTGKSSPRRARIRTSRSPTRETDRRKHPTHPPTPKNRPSGRAPPPPPLPCAQFTPGFTCAGDRRQATRTGTANASPVGRWDPTKTAPRPLESPLGDHPLGRPDGGGRRRRRKRIKRRQSERASEFHRVPPALFYRHDLFHSISPISPNHGMR